MINIQPVFLLPLPVAEKTKMNIISKRGKTKQFKPKA